MFVDDASSVRNQGIYPMAIQEFAFKTAMAITAMVLFAQSASAQVPSQADIGRVDAGVRNQWYTQQYWPFWGRPINDADVTPYQSEEPVIQFLNMDVKGELAPSPLGEIKLKENSKEATP